MTKLPLTIPLTCSRDTGTLTHPLNLSGSGSITFCIEIFGRPSAKLDFSFRAYQPPDELRTTCHCTITHALNRKRIQFLNFASVDSSISMEVLDLYIYTGRIRSFYVFIHTGS